MRLFNFKHIITLSLVLHLAAITLFSFKESCLNQIVNKSQLTIHKFKLGLVLNQIQPKTKLKKVVKKNETSKVSKRKIAEVPKKTLSQKEQPRDQIVSIENATRRPQVMASLSPVYPLLAREKGIEGRVLIEVIIGLDGSVESTKVIQSPHQLLSIAASKSLMGSKFSPGFFDSKPVRVKAIIPIHFKLNS